MKYRAIQRRNPTDPTAPKKWYVTSVKTGTVTQRSISNDIVESSSLTHGDVSHAIESLLNAIPRYLLLGNSVKLGVLGTFRLSVSSPGVDAPEDVNANIISRVKVIYTPSPELRKQIQIKHVKFEKA